MQKGGIMVFMIVKIFKLFIMEIFNIHKMGKGLPCAHDPSLIVINFACLVFVKNLKPIKCLKTGEDLNKLGYIYLECYKTF